MLPEIILPIGVFARQNFPHAAGDVCPYAAAMPVARANTTTPVTNTRRIISRLQIPVFPFKPKRHLTAAPYIGSGRSGMIVDEEGGKVTGVVLCCGKKAILGYGVGDQETVEPGWI
jgi:hypothetical protein